MNLRLALYELSARHGLDAAASRALQRAAGLEEPPRELSRRLQLGIAMAAAALAGLGVIFWLAANWGELGRFGRFALLQGLVAATLLAAWRWPAARAPLGLLALLAIGGLFAYFGQTYQTGADAWQLFALWAALALPLCLGLRSDLLWAPWTLVAMTAIALWVQAHASPVWGARAGDLPVHAAGWGAAAALCLALAPPWRRWLGTGPWASRSAVTLAVVLVTVSALGGLFGHRVAPHYALGLLLLAAGAGLLSLRTGFDVFALSAVALGLNVLLVAGLGRLLFDGARDGEPIGSLLLLGLAAAGLLAGTVGAILRLNRCYLFAEQG